MAVIKIMVSGNDKLKTALIQALKKQPGIMIVEEDADLSKIVSRNDVPNVSVIRKIAEDFSRLCICIESNNGKHRKPFADIRKFPVPAQCMKLPSRWCPGKRRR